MWKREKVFIFRINLCTICQNGADAIFAPDTACVVECTSSIVVSGSN